MSGVAFLIMLQAASSVPSPAYPVPLDGPAREIRIALESASRGVETAEACAHVRRNYAERLEQLRGRFNEVLSRAETLYGPPVASPSGYIVLTIHCSRDNRRRYVAEIELGLERTETALRTRLAEMPGLWLGPLRLCRDTVERIDLIEDWDGSKVPAIRFAPSFHAAMRAETESRVGKPLGLYLDGRLILAPNVMEPISAAMQLSGLPEPGALEAMKAAAALPC